MPKDKKMLSFQVPIELFEQLTLIAKTDTMKRSAFCRRILRQAIKNRRIS